MARPRRPTLQITRLVRDSEAGSVRQEVVSPRACDFCMDVGPRWSYPALRFELSGGVFSSGEWCVCDPCASLVEAGEKRELARRALEGLPPSPAAYKLSARIIEAFFQNRAGER